MYASHKLALASTAVEVAIRVVTVAEIALAPTIWTIRCTKWILDRTLLQSMLTAPSVNTIAMTRRLKCKREDLSSPLRALTSCQQLPNPLPTISSRTKIEALVPIYLCNRDTPTASSSHFYLMPWASPLQTPKTWPNSSRPSTVVVRRTLSELPPVASLRTDHAVEARGIKICRWARLCHRSIKPNRRVLEGPKLPAHLQMSSLSNPTTSARCPSQYARINRTIQVLTNNLKLQ